MHSDTPYPLLTLDDPQGTARILIRLGWIRDGETVTRVARAGEGNMNLVLRVTTSERSLIVKQSRPWVEKYPSIEAPADRMLVEIAFYEAVRPYPDMAQRMPGLLGVDRELRLAAFEDLGDVLDFTSLYRGAAVGEESLSVLAQWLSALHRTAFGDDARAALTNRPMRALNHAHLFVIPLQPANGLDLDGITPGLAEQAGRLQRDASYRAVIGELGRRYLEDGPVLLHGDYYPGSWVRAADGPRIIDPEFCFFGPAEYDVGVMIAHLLMARVPDEDIADLLEGYQPPVGFEPDLAGRFAGMEIMRRLIGVAQLPLERSLDEAALLARSHALVLGRDGVRFL